MEFLGSLLSVSKVALIFFVLTLGFITYEIALYFKERSSDETPHVPNFDPNVHTPSSVISNASPVQANTQIPHYKKNRLLPLLFATVILIILGIFAFFYTPDKKKEVITTSSTRIVPTPTFTIPTSIIIPTSIVTSQTPTKIITPTKTLITATPTSINLVNTTSNTPTESQIASPTKKMDRANAETLPTVGTYQYLLLLTVFATTIVVVSLIF